MKRSFMKRSAVKSHIVKSCVVISNVVKKCVVKSHVLKNSLALLALLAPAIPSLAADSSDPELNGLYMALSLGKANHELELGGEFGGNEAFDGLSDSDSSMGLTFGFEHNPYFSTEASLVYLGNSIHDNEGIEFSTDIETLNLSLVGQAPVNQQFSFFGKIGVAFWDAELTTTDSDGARNEFDDEGADMLLGFGALLNIGNRARLGMEYTYYQLQTKGSRELDVDRYALTLGIRF